MGPMTLFDKSFLEMLSVDEASIFDMLYMTIISPVFITEAIADLSKVPPGSRTVEKIVSDLASKSPSFHSYPNVEYTRLCLGELFGHSVDMRGVTARGGGRIVRKDNKLALIYDESDEAKAFNRWQNGEFLELEREFASSWREQMKSADHRLLSDVVRNVLSISEKPKTYADAYRIARQIIEGEATGALLRVTTVLLGISSDVHNAIHERWVSRGKPNIAAFAPYTAYCLLVELFFHICIDKCLISPDRPSNRVDMSYLFYLPFCELFVSNDKLHRTTAPLFLRGEQQFVFGGELKGDLTRLNTRYSKLSKDEKTTDLFRIAAYPPEDNSYLTTRLWKEFGRSTKREATKPLASPGVDTKILAELRNMKNGAPVSPKEAATIDQNAVDNVMIERRVSRRMGKWKILPDHIK